MALMKLEKWTEKAREALVKAGELAREYQQGQAEREHVLVALLEQEDGAVAEMAQKGGGDLIAARRAARGEVERVPRVEEGNEPTFSPRLRKLLDEAWQEMSQFKDEYLSVEHLLLAMLKAGDEPVR